MGKLQRVLIMAGGTGGHVFPGLAVAKRLQEKGVDVVWLGTERGLESKLVSAASIPMHTLSINGVRGKGIKALVTAPFQLVIAIYQAIRAIKQIKPDVVLGMGGFVSGPGGIASWLLRCPLVIHEQNAKPGTTNRWLAPVAKKVLEGFAGTFPLSQKVETVGNPVRESILRLQPLALREKALPLRLLIVGGSLGAAAINQLVPAALALLPLEVRPQVYHQTGEKNYQETVAHYQQLGLTAEVVPFINEMDKAYAWSDLVLCRAGALTIAELCAAGRGALLVPFPFAIDDHQTANANVMVKHAAALLLPQATLTARALADILIEMSVSQQPSLMMAKAAYALRKTDATDKIVTICEEFCQ